MATLVDARPTAGQLALAQLLAQGGTRANRGITHVDAAAYTSPNRHAAEQARIFSRAPLVIGPSALLPDATWRCRMTASASRCLSRATRPE